MIQEISGALWRDKPGAALTFTLAPICYILTTIHPYLSLVCIVLSWLLMAGWYFKGMSQGLTEK
jgi:hypothetical protein